MWLWSPLVVAVAGNYRDYGFKGIGRCVEGSYITDGFATVAYDLSTSHVLPSISD